MGGAIPYMSPYISKTRDFYKTILKIDTVEHSRSESGPDLLMSTSTVHRSTSVAWNPKTKKFSVSGKFSPGNDQICN